MKLKVTDRVFLFLKLSTALVLIGRGYQLIFFGGPLRVLLWDQKLLEKPLLFLFGMTWEEYAGNLQIDQAINLGHISIGVFFMVAAMLLILYNKKYFFIEKILIVTFVLLTILYALEFKDNFFRVGNLIEHFAQLLTPVLLVVYSRERFNFFKTVGLIAISFTFIGHGLYAVGFYPRPGRFVDLVIGSIGCNETTAVAIITTAGIIDFVVSIGIFFPRFSKICLKYMVFWGFLTAISRITADFNFDFFWNSIHQSFYLTAYRVCHGLLPLSVLLYLKKEQ